MKNFLLILVLFSALSASACGPLQAFRPVDQGVVSNPVQIAQDTPASQVVSIETATPENPAGEEQAQTTQTAEATGYEAPAVEVTQYAIPDELGTAPRLYANSDFGLRFQIPGGWYGPDEYVSGDTLRVAVGSDIVYRYGTDSTEQVYTQKDGYQVVVQYSRNDQNNYWRETLQVLGGLADGETVTSGRSKLIKVRGLLLGRFEGIEFISTLSESAQTEAVYSRQVILVDAQNNLVTIMGTPNNVVVTSGGDWRAVYQAVDAKYEPQFHTIVDSLVVE